MSSSYITVLEVLLQVLMCAINHTGSLVPRLHPLAIVLKEKGLVTCERSIS